MQAKKGKSIKSGKFDNSNLDPVVDTNLGPSEEELNLLQAKKSKKRKAAGPHISNPSLVKRLLSRSIRPTLNPPTESEETE